MTKNNRFFLAYAKVTANSSNKKVIMNPVLTSISQFGRILGSLFYYSPDQAQNQPLLALFAGEQWQSSCDFLPQALLQQLQSDFTDSITLFNSYLDRQEFDNERKATSFIRLDYAQ